MKLPVFHDPVTGDPSLSATLVAITFSVVLVKWMVGGNTALGHTFAVVSTGEIDAWLTPVFFLYFGRKATVAGARVASARSGRDEPVG